MRIKYAAVCVLLLLLPISCANAGWSSLKSGYAVTTDYHGLEATVETLITATAGTTDTSITNVTFVWKYPNDTIAFEDADVPVWSNGTKYPDENGSLIYYAQSSFAPSVEGKWGVQAYFKGAGGHLRGNGTDIIAIKATSNDIVIPEISIEGIAVTILAMSLILILLNGKKKLSSIVK
jgi:hypothetical protein